MTNFAQFFVPYIEFLRGAAYNIAQIIEGLSPTTLTFVIGGADSRMEFGYSVPIEFIAGMLLLYSFLLVVLIVVAAYILGRWRGTFTALLLLVFPGVASIFDFWPNINYSPETIVLGRGGTLGNPLGMFPLVLMGLLTGWSLVVIFSDLLSLKDNFRHYYDHVWYSLAMLTGIFFVTDSNLADVVRELQETHQESRQASAYLLQQVRTYDLQCQQLRRGRRWSGPGPLPSVGTVSCAWASEVQQLLSDYITQHTKLFQTFGPKSGSDVYNPPVRLGRELSPEQILTLRREIQAYNDSQCPVEARGEGWIRYSRPSGRCQRPPSIFCTAFPEPLDGHVDDNILGRTVAIASECIIPSLVASRARQEKLQAVVDDKTRTKYIRWLFFILLSFVIGGKVANATSRAIELDKRPEQEKRRILKLLRPVWLGPKNVVGLAIKGCRAGLGYAFIGLYRIARAILPRWSG